MLDCADWFGDYRNLRFYAAALVAAFLKYGGLNICPLFLLVHTHTICGYLFSPVTYDINCQNGGNESVSFQHLFAAKGSNYSASMYDACV